MSDFFIIIFLSERLCRHSDFTRKQSCIAILYFVPWYHGCFLYPSVFRVHFHSQRLIEVTQTILMIPVKFVHLYFPPKCKLFSIFQLFPCTYYTMSYPETLLFIGISNLFGRKKQTLSIGQKIRIYGDVDVGWDKGYVLSDGGWLSISPPKPFGIEFEIL